MTSRTHRWTVALAVAAVAGALSLAGCSGTSDRDDPRLPPRDRGIDARAWYDDYDAGSDEDYASGSAPMASAAAGGAVADSAGSLVTELPEVPRVPGPLEDNTFVDAGSSGFVDASADDRSTFALDVDTGSFTVGRTLLEQGLLPPPDSVRVEEWVNALAYDDPSPMDADLGITAETGTAPGLDDGTQLVRVAVAAREVAPAERRPVNVTLVVDRSGSMDIRERLGLVQSSLALLADHLRDDDTVSVVSFEDEATPILPPTKVSDTDAILDAIDELEPGGSTNLEAGLDLGYRQARESFREDGVNLVVLASDGVANVGATGPGSIAERIAEEGADGIHLVTVGYGMGNYNDHLMEQLADLGDGFYRYVDSYDEAETLFGDELTSVLTPVAAEARAQVVLDPAAVTSYRLVGYENRAIADDDFEDLADDTVDAGELGSGHRATALYEVRLADGVAPGAEIGTASVRWTSVADGSAQEAGAPLLAAEGGAEPSPAYALAATVADLAQAVKADPAYAERGITFDDLVVRAQELADLDVPGADEVLALARAARDVRPSPQP